jgi:hypothetical protein
MLEEMGELEGEITTDEGPEGIYDTEEGTKHYHDRNQTSFGPLVQIGPTSWSMLYDIVPGDIDNDGTIDFAAMNGDFEKWKNSGVPFESPSMWSEWSQPLGNSDSDLGDLDNDGDLDLVTTNGSAVYILENPINPGGLDPWTNAWSIVVIDTTPFPAITALKFADFDNDGDLDIVYKAHEIFVLENPKNPGGDPWVFLGWSSNSAYPFGGPLDTIDVADFNLDGLIDIVIFDVPGTEILKNDGTPFSGVWPDAMMPWPPMSPNKVTVGDMDNDGDPDIVTGDMAEVRLFQNPSETGDPFVVPWSHMGISNLGGASSLAISDFDNDGWMDIGFSAFGWIQILENAQTPWVASSWQLTIVTDHATVEFYSIASSDLDNDGDADLIGFGTDFAVGNFLYVWNNTLIHRNMPLNDFIPVPAQIGSIEDLELGDFDNDGDLDVATASQGADIPVPTVHVWKNNEPWEQSSWSPINPIDNGSRGSDAVKIGDLDNDGDLDLVTITEKDFNWTLFVWENPLESADPFAVQWSSGTGVIVGFLADFFIYTAYVDIGDLDNDGDIDIATHCMSLNGILEVRIWRNPLYEGGDPFTPGWSSNQVGMPPFPAKDASAITIGDLDRDGDVDIVSSDYSDFWVEVRVWENLNSAGVDPWSGTWSGGTGEEIWIFWNLYPLIRMKLSDLDNDGDLDLPLVLTAGIGLVKELRNPNDPSTAANEPFTQLPWTNVTIGNVNPLGKQLLSIDAGDLDNDGDNDVVTGDVLFGPMMMKYVKVWTNPLVEGGDPWLGSWAYDEYPITIGGVGGVLNVALGDLDNKNNTGMNKAGDLDVVCSIEFGPYVNLLENIGAQITELVTPKSTPPSIHNILEGSTEDLMRIDVTHNGVSWDNDAELTTWRFYFENGAVPLVTAEAQALFDNMYIYLDSSGDYAWQPSPTDTIVVTIPSASFSIVGGYQTFSFADPDLNAVITADMNETYFLVVQLAGSAASASPNIWNVTFDPDGYSTGNWNEVEDEDEDRILTVLYDDPTVAGIFRAISGALPDLIPGDLPIPTGIEVNGVPVTGAIGNPPMSDQIDVGIGTANLISSIATNIGAAGTGIGFDAAFYNCTSTGVQLDPAFYVNSLPPLASGASSAPFSENWDAPLVPSTDYYVCILVDSNSDVVEFNEMNNIYIIHFYTNPIPMPDLIPGDQPIPTDIQVDAAPVTGAIGFPPMSDQIDVDVSTLHAISTIATNIGTGDTGSGYNISFYECDTKGVPLGPTFFDAAMPSLAPGASSAPVGGPWTAPPVPGVHTYVCIMVDNNEVVAEADETNNIYIIHFYTIGIADRTPPDTLNVRVDAQVLATYSICALPPSILLTATIDDSLTGNSNIGGGNYTIGVLAWPGTNMNPTDGAFDSPTEDVNITVDISGFGLGTYMFFVYGWDIVPNNNTSSEIYATLEIVDDCPPLVENLRLNGQPTLTTTAGTMVDVTATLNDTTTGNNDILSANYTIGAQNWPGAPMNAVVAPFDNPVEDVISPSGIDTTGWAIGLYVICVYGSDVLGNNNTAGACTTISIAPEFIPPEIYNVLVDGVAAQTYYLSTLPATFVLTATVDDTNTGGSNIGTIALGGANYTMGTFNWPGTSMNAVDGTWSDDVVEPVTLAISTPVVSGTYTYCVYGWDEWLNYNTTSTACATLTVVDDIPPAILDVHVDGAPTQDYGISVLPATIVLTATVDDTNTGSSDIAGANYTLDAQNWPGIPMSASDGSFDSAMEDVTATVDVSNRSIGTYTICVYGWDAVPNYNSTGSCAQFTIYDDVPPEIQDSADPNPQKAGGLVNVSAEITDNVGISGAWIEILDPSGNSLGNHSLSLDAKTGKYFFENPYTVIGTYTYTIWAVDTGDNWNSSSGTFEIEEDTQPETRIEYNWKPIIALLFTIILLLFGLLVSYKRPYRFSGNLQKDRMYTFLGGVLPFMVAEITTGIVSLVTGFLRVPPILGLGMAVDLTILLSGIVIASVIFKKGEMPAYYEAGLTEPETDADVPPTASEDETSGVEGQDADV